MLEKLKGNLLYSILRYKCPRCHEGDFFVNNRNYDLKNLTKNHEKCSNCGLRYEREVGFFFGAMFVSYALSVAFAVAIGVAVLVLFPSASYKVYIVAILIGLVILSPFAYRLSRLIWINLFQKYEGDKKEVGNK